MRDLTWSAERSARWSADEIVLVEDEARGIMVS